ncbi:MAG: type II restriction endonuclease subunit M [Burkholderiaceae bacterium]|nr:type II restriction endonuclease subunit M [Burkholderiaceae bacterium]
MSQFLRLLSEGDKANALQQVSQRLRAGEADARVLDVPPQAFDAVPGKPFAYWVSEAVRETFQRLPAFESEGRTVKQGLATADDFRFVRGWWEVGGHATTGKWFSFAKGGAYSPYYADVYLVVNWEREGAEIKNNLNDKGGVRSNVWMLRDTATKYFLREGLTWSRRAHLKGSFRVIPRESIFSDSGPCAFDDDLLLLAAILNSSAYLYLLMLLMPRGTEGGQTLKLEVGYVASVPIPMPSCEQKELLRNLSSRSWHLKRALDSIRETSHAFMLPTALRARVNEYDSPAIEVELSRIQTEIDAIAFDLYGFSDADRQAALSSTPLPEGEGQSSSAEGDDSDDDADDSADSASATQHDGLLSWAVGVAFGRFDWRLATGERTAPPEPEPFDPLPAKSPGMLPKGAASFHTHAGILVDEPGHPHDLARLVEEVLSRVNAPVPDDVRRWLQRDFFAFHLQRYSKSRRKAPIYWPLATTSGSYTLWVYYPSLTSQTLYTAINDFIEPKLKQVGADVTALRNKGSNRSRDDEKQFEALQAFELELIELRDTLLKLAPTYKPNFDDGVQITAAPLWPLFRHKPWQKVLKDTWAKLEKGDYDWAMLAMNYWPDRVREKCKTDKSLAIAHGLEDLYVEPEAVPKKTRKKKGEA